MDIQRSEHEVFQDLSELCVSSGYIHAIAFFCFKDNIVRFGEEPSTDDLAEQYSHDRLIRTEISTVLGLMIKNSVDFTIPKPEILQRYIDDTDRLLKELHQSMNAPATAMFMDIIENKKNDNPFTKGAFLREAIFYAAESAYDYQYLDFFVKKYQNDDEWLTVNKGFSIQDVGVVINAIVYILHQKLHDFAEKLIKRHIDEWTTLDIFSFTVDEIAKITEDGSPELIVNILREFTVNDSNEQFVALGDYNIINAKPLIQQDDSTYILFQHYGLLEAAYESPFFWFKQVDERYFNTTATKNRGDFTENFSYEVLSKIFGDDKVFKNIDIYDNKKRVGEIDVLVVFANRAIVLQAKSKKLTIDARKGNDKLLADDFKKAIQASYDQGFDCAKFIQDNKYRLTDAFGNEISIRNDFKEIYIFCVISDHYPALAFQTQQFLQYEESDTIKPPFVMDIFLLDVMAEMLSNPLYFLSYVNKRTSYFKEFIAHSELTILSFHLKRNLYLSDDFSLMFLDDDISADLDLALLVRKKGLTGKDTPDGILTKFKDTIIGNFFESIQDTEDEYTIEIGFFLLTLSEETIFQLNEGIQKTIDLFLKDGNNHDFSVGFSDTAAGLTIHSNQLARQEAYRKLKDHCEYRKYRQQADVWFGLCLDPILKKFKFGIMSNKAWCYSRDMGQKVVDRLVSNNIKIGRNDTCPCGSGKKYKKCCIGNI
ncbi:YecA family protein [Sulfuricurvum sp.]|uniref:YecA family protein n=1 Tax=Sulfuricurvum sp. TaxID=2025608 RepID=UPI002D725CDE|nr:SEC-C metal-binding domain-containing protein [Sulfuricurvum sp.]HZF70939.1 SEC-C metal-binding domain-containing protein [Sulfuricurvum sp.]